MREHNPSALCHFSATSRATRGEGGGGGGGLLSKKQYSSAAEGELQAGTGLGNFTVNIDRTIGEARGGWSQSKNSHFQSLPTEHFVLYLSLFLLGLYLIHSCVE